MIYKQPSIYKNCDIDKLIRELHGFKEVISPFSIATGFIEQTNKFYINEILGLAIVELKAYGNSMLTTNAFATAFNNDNSYNFLSLIGSQFVTPLNNNGLGTSDCMVIGAINTGPGELHGKYVVRKFMGNNNAYGFYASQLYAIGD